MRSARLAVILDCCCVLAFVIIGRASHVQGESLAGIASTAWPFLAGLAGGWLATAGRAWRQPFRLWPAGVSAWLGTVALGMVFRVVSGQGTAPAFIGVALAFLGLFLLGWRLLAQAVIKSRGLRRGLRPPVSLPGGRADAMNPGSTASERTEPLLSWRWEEAGQAEGRPGSESL